MWLADGVVQSDGPIEGVLSDYRAAIEARAEEDARMQGGIRVTSMTVTGEDGRLPEVAGDCTIRLTLTSDKEQNARLFLGVSEGAATPIFVVMNGTTIPEGETTFEVTLEHLPLPPKRFFLWFGAWHMKTKDEITPWQPIGPLILHGRRRLDPVPKAIVRLSPVYVSAHWSRVGG
jgi:ABC-2 type transport system ATP-binding protein